MREFYEIIAHALLWIHTLPRIGLSGVENSDEIAACRKSMAEWGTENGWANAWNADPQVICQGAM